ncbi:hypothetical protein N0V93_010003 [Gnomoniopsis smithogilvyi]|uniref:3-ketoacyl-ACP reductase n=1 Tax=Gnomoniopsis smithogilvyi TaxID=1191159 RepID=A0A9W8YJI0_9PEZI|nr:hypothetical protein N0V93_010003 [Gnomoniopsis smithogilvyi]
MQLGLTGKVVLVTGGTKSIGHAIVQGFLNEGAIVHFCSRTTADVDRAAKEFTLGSGAEAHGATVDVSQPDQIKTWVQSVADSHNGRIDVVVSNVSALAVLNTPENWDATFATDIKGTHTLIEAATPFLKATKGNIINISSVSGRYIDFTAPGAYGSFKAALLHYISQLGHTLAKDGVRANSVSPGNIYVEDGFWGQVERGMPEFFAEQMKANRMGRMGKPEEVADAVVWLASDRASFVNGTNLLVDGAVSTAVQF